MILTQGDMDINIVISDVRSPGRFDGVGLARWIRTNKPGLKVIHPGSVEKTTETAATFASTDRS